MLRRDAFGPTILFASTRSAYWARACKWGWSLHIRMCAALHLPRHPLALQGTDELSGRKDRRVMACSKSSAPGVLANLREFSLDMAFSGTRAMIRGRTRTSMWALNFFFMKSVAVVSW